MQMISANFLRTVGWYQTAFGFATRFEDHSLCAFGPPGGHRRIHPRVEQAFLSVLIEEELGFRA